MQDPNMKSEITLETPGNVLLLSVEDALIGGVFSGLVATVTIEGADVAHPPVNYCKPSDDEKIANAFKPKI